MNWVRVAVGIGDDPRIHQLAETLGVRSAEAVGLVVGVMVRLPEHAPDGDLSCVPASLLERWAGWEGVRGTFAERFGELFLTDGVWESWERHNGAAIREAHATRDRMRALRSRRKDVGDFPRSPDGSANGTANGSPNGSPNASPDGTALRTRRTERTNEREEEAAAPLTERFTVDEHRRAYAAYRMAHRMPDGLDASLRNAHEPMTHGKGASWERIGAALVEMRAAQVAFSPNALAGFLRRLGESGPLTPHEAKQARLKAAGDKLDAEIAAGLRTEMF